MKFTLSWLKDHLSLDKSSEEIATILTDLGLEIEKVELSDLAMDMIVCEVQKFINIQTQTG